MLDKIIATLSSNQPRRFPNDFPEAAVLVPVTRENCPQIILTRRAEHMKTHSGQVAFPGGMRDPSDQNLRDTALRETFEEVGVSPEKIEVVGSLNQVVSRHGIAVTPYVGIVDPEVELIPDPNELHSIFKAPVSFFLENEPDRLDKINFEQYRLQVPCWYYGDYEIWGVSAIILMDFFRVSFNRRIGSFTEDRD
ncbi:CoA pyrophosphatase [Hahella sp. KA22]|uniref:CoA pyrophosphatase n=1 Tax=Hahella sp. KA22 TaxID=1628392 RepID=UPI000FDE2F9E|nr:CoA pyrophosphatase [Hahella sp. KA22]AZZ93432.1 CoA pyrophosphatase [Hahella sp. KA22]QAY56807.1 CoA pyrophosphatase [Hahella sp. KA22]